MSTPTRAIPRKFYRVAYQRFEEAEVGLDHGIGHLRPLGLTRHRPLLAYHYMAISHEGLRQVF